MFGNKLRSFRRLCASYRRFSNLKTDDRLLKSLAARGKLDLLQKLQKDETIDENELPNLVHPSVLGYGNEANVVETVNELPVFSKTPFRFDELCDKMNLLRMDVGQFAGSRSYYLMDDLAELETALILYAVTELRQRGFELISVPDILPAHSIEACGMQVYGERNQVYKMSNRQDGSDLCLSGTAEMALANYVAGRTFTKAELPLRLMAVSRCFRAETSSVHEEKGIYRVHQFNKVEMFGVSEAEQSQNLMEEFRGIQTNIFQKLGLNFKILDMPPHELGDPAYRKYDMESWMPGRKMYGELSSCSNCTDYQSRRLNIRVEDGRLAHTVNGTAVAIPRLLIAIVESFQNLSSMCIDIPPVLHKFLGKNKISHRKALPIVKLVKDMTREMVIKPS